MFFPRLRRQAKWMFVLLAAFFAGGFVLFGVGAGGIGLGDILRGSSSSAPAGQISEGQARDRIEKNPKDAEAHRALARELQVDGKTAEAIAELEQYVKLRPRDRDGLAELAGLYTNEAARLGGEAQAAQAETQFAGVESTYGLGPTVRGTPTLSTDPITSAVTAQTNERASSLISRYQSAARKATSTYKRLAAVAPDDATVQINLATTAEAAGDVPTAISAYQRYVKLSPTDPTVPQVKARIKELQKAVRQSPNATSSAG